MNTIRDVSDIRHLKGNGLIGLLLLKDALIIIVLEREFYERSITFRN